MKQISLFVLIGILSGCYSRTPEKTGKEGKPIPSFKILEADSLTSFDTKNIVEGKPGVLFYYGPYCPYSRAQMEELIDEMSTLKDIQFYIFTAYPFSDMKKFNAEYKLSQYPNIVSGVIENSTPFTNYFKIAGVPFTAVYGKDRKLIKAYLGKVYSTQILKDLND